MLFQHNPHTVLRHHSHAFTTIYVINSFDNRFCLYCVYFVLESPALRNALNRNVHKFKGVRPEAEVENNRG